MPCMGPDLGAARKHGRNTGESMLKGLIERENFLDIDDPKYNDLPGFPGDRERWKAAKEKFIQAVEELFVEDAANSF